MVRQYRLWTREPGVPHCGQAAVGAVACRWTMTSDPAPQWYQDPGLQGMQKQGRDRWEGLQMTHRDFDSAHFTTRESPLQSKQAHLICPRADMSQKNEVLFVRQHYTIRPRAAQIDTIIL